MRAIVKGAEPASLTEHRALPNTDYDSYRDKDDLRAHLVAEQRGLCCYCLSRIAPERGRMKIEHWHCRENYRAEELDYSNLLGACMGNEGQPAGDQYCDTRKGDRDLSRNPANPAHRVEDLIRFKGDGRISSDDPVLNEELNGILNLNHPFLVNNRKEILTAFKDALPKLGRLSRARIERLLGEWNGETTTGDLRPFCQVVVYWLRKRLARA